MAWHKISARISKKPETQTTEKQELSKASPSEQLNELSNTLEQISVPKTMNYQTRHLYNANGEKFSLAGELLFFILAVLVSFLFWFTLAIIIEQNIIAPGHIYLRERNAFFLTIVFFYFLRLSAWMTNKADTHKGSNWEIEVPVTQKFRLGQRFVGYAKDEASQVKNDGKLKAAKRKWENQETASDDRRQRPNKGLDLGIGE